MAPNLINLLILSFITHMGKLTKSRKNSIPVASYRDFQVQSRSIGETGIFAHYFRGTANAMVNLGCLGSVDNSRIGLR